MTVTTAPRIQVEILEHIAWTKQMEIWDDYEQAFQRNAHHNPCRQYYHREDFADAMRSPDYVKLAGRLGDEIVFLVLLTRKFESLTWIEPAYYDYHWPELVNHRMYISAIYIREDKKGSPVLFRRLIKSITDYMTANGIKAVFYDHGGSGPIESLTDVVKMITGAILIEPTGTQIYGGFLYQPS